MSCELNDSVHLIIFFYSFNRFKSSQLSEGAKTLDNFETFSAFESKGNNLLQHSIVSIEGP